MLNSTPKKHALWILSILAAAPLFAAPSSVRAGDETHRTGIAKAVDAVEEALRLKRTKLTPKILADETSRGNLDRMRVHLSEALVIVRETDPQEVSHKVDSDGIEEITQLDRRVQTLKPKAKGKILDVEGDQVWVKFNNECAARECAFTFTRDGSKFVLDSVPLDLAFAHTTVYLKDFGIIRERMDAFHGLHDILGKELHLKVDRDTITTSIPSARRSTASAIEAPKFRTAEMVKNLIPLTYAHFTS